MPLGLLNLVVVFISQVLLILFYLSRHLVELEIVSFPVVDYPNYVFQRRSEVWVWSQHVPNEILHFFRTASRVSYSSIHNAQLSFLLERMVSIVHDKKNTAKHPDIDSFIHWVL